MQSVDDRSNSVINLLRAAALSDPTRVIIALS